MSRGTVDVFTSRRTNFLECEYWLVAKGEELEKDRIIHENEPNGKFFAKYETYIVNTNSVIAQTFMFDSTDTSISTEDNIDEIKKNALIRINNDLIWRVNSVSKVPIKNNFQFDTAVKYKTFLELRR